jgi:hypothetical protein
MAASPYRAFSFQPYELLSSEMTNQLNNNIQYLYENTPRVLYTVARIKRAEGVRIACGKVVFERQKNDQAGEAVHFSNFFSSGCQPVITTGILSTGQRKIFATYTGLNSTHPTHNGFRLRVEIDASNKKKDSITKQFWVTWIAMGY